MAFEEHFLSYGCLLKFLCVIFIACLWWFTVNFLLETLHQVHPFQPKETLRASIARIQRKEKGNHWHTHFEVAKQLGWESRPCSPTQPHYHCMKALKSRAYYDNEFLLLLNTTTKNSYSRLSWVFYMSYLRYWMGHYSSCWLKDVILNTKIVSNLPFVHHKNYWKALVHEKNWAFSHSWSSPLRRCLNPS